MKKIFGLALAFILTATVSIGQVATTTSSETVDKTKTCVPTKECAEKHGMTLEECIKKCNSNSAEASTTSVASASLVADTKEVKKACCTSVAACAKKAGMTVAECKAKCDGKSKSAMNTEDGETKVAAASLVNEVEASTTDEKATKKCCKSTSACTKKKG